MTDFYTVVHRAISALPDKTGPNRRAVYDKARKALLRQLQSFDPPLPSADVTSQRLALEDAIRKIESEIARNLRTRRASESPRHGGQPPAAERQAQGPHRPGPADDARPPRRPASGPGPVETRSAGTADEVRDVSPPEPPAPGASVGRAGDEAAAAVAVPADAMTPLAPGAVGGKARLDQLAAADLDDPATDDRSVLALAEEDKPPRGGFAEPGEPTPYLETSDDDGAPGFGGDEGPRRDRHEPDVEADAGEEGLADAAPAQRQLRASPSPEERRERRRRRQERQERRQAASGMAADDGAQAEAAREEEPTETAPIPPKSRRRRRDRKAAAAEARARQAAAAEGLAEPDGSDDVGGEGRLPAGVAAPHELARRSDRPSRTARFAVPVLVALIVIGLGAGVYAQREQILAMISPAPPQLSASTQSGTVSKKVTDRLGAPPESGSDDLATRPVATTRVVTPSEPGGDAPAAEDETPDGPADAATPDSTADTAAGVETASVSGDQATATDAAGAAPAATVRRAESSAPQASSPTGEQRAILYEEGGTGGEDGAVVNGNVSWEIVNQSFGGQDPEPVVRASIDIPGRDLKARLIIRENRDDTLPASHLLEISFESADGAASELVANVPGLIMKEAEDARGNALLGAAARVSTGLFWIALSANPEDEQTNRRLLSERTWIDVPILYESGQRAILTLQKGAPGERAVTQAFEAWSKG